MHVFEKTMTNAYGIKQNQLHILVNMILVSQHFRNGFILSRSSYLYQEDYYKTIEWTQMKLRLVEPLSCIPIKNGFFICLTSHETTFIKRNEVELESESIPFPCDGYFLFRLYCKGGGSVLETWCDEIQFQRYLDWGEIIIQLIKTVYSIELHIE